MPKCIHENIKNILTCICLCDIVIVHIIIKVYTKEASVATIHSKTTNGHKYWYIVESRRVNGKPRPIVLEYLGNAETLLKRLQGLSENVKLKSYSHGLVASMLSIANELDICPIINKYCCSSKKYMAEKPIRNNLTVGATMMLAAIERGCTTSSKRKWSSWAKTTSLEYMLRLNFSKVDSQHFWDMMDCIPEEKIPVMEEKILENVMTKYDIKSETLFFDTTNYYTFINTSNTVCDIAQRGKNKQKRNDLRQVGLALVVTRQNMIPIFHHSYEGNMNDSKVFKTVISKIRDRLISLGLQQDKHTIVFDRGNNSKKNLNLIINELGLHYVGALTPYHHKDLIEEAYNNLNWIAVRNKPIEAFRARRNIWGHDMTLVVLVSDKLKQGQIKGIYASISKCESNIIEINKSIESKRSRLTKEQIEKKVDTLLSKYGTSRIIDATVGEETNGENKIYYNINYSELAIIEEEMGFRILMTNRHDWSTEEIIEAYHGQSYIENAFKNMKDPNHLSLNPQFHWTDQKIRVHNFYCVLSYLLCSLLYKTVKDKTSYMGSYASFLDEMKDIRLGTLVELTGKKGKPKAIYKLEEMSETQQDIVRALDIVDLHNNRPKIKGLGVYK
jgi:transposase